MLTLNIRVGGLFRCCINTADVDARMRELPPREGEKLTCIHCKKTTMVYKDHAWEWVGLSNIE